MLGQRIGSFFGHVPIAHDWASLTHLLATSMRRNGPPFLARSIISESRPLDRLGTPFLLAPWTLELYIGVHFRQAEVS